MIRHLLKLAWNRKRGYVLLELEFVVCFLIVAAMAIAGLDAVTNYRRPLGFQCAGVWAVSLTPVDQPEQEWSAADSLVLQQAFQVVSDLEDVEAVSGNTSQPLMGSLGLYGIWVNDIQTSLDLGFAGDDLDRVLNLDITAGRWFSAQDDAAAFSPVVINQELARQLYGDEDPLGKPFHMYGPKYMARGEDARSQGKVVGVVSDYRQSQFSEPHGFVFRRANLRGPGVVPQGFTIRLRPGAPRTFVRTLRERLQAVAPGWRVDVQSVEQRRVARVHDKVRDFTLFGVVGGFLMVLVALGLVGVMWQSVTERTREIGVRRAVGAPGWRVHLQFVGEALVLGVVASVVGAALIAQATAMGLDMRAGVLVSGGLVAALVINWLVVAAALYPGWLATRISPATALHHD
jgi:putative ABC transport system permease protein